MPLPCLVAVAACQMSGGPKEILVPPVRIRHPKVPDGSTPEIFRRHRKFYGNVTVMFLPCHLSHRSQSEPLSLPASPLPRPLTLRALIALDFVKTRHQILY